MPSATPFGYEVTVSLLNICAPPTGAFFDYHAVLQNAVCLPPARFTHRSNFDIDCQTVDVIDASHPSTSMLPAQWHVQDEMWDILHNYLIQRSPYSSTRIQGITLNPIPERSAPLLFFLPTSPVTSVRLRMFPGARNAFM